MNEYNSNTYTRTSKPPMRARVIISYVADYVIIVILAAIFFALDAVTPFHQHFALQNYTLQYPYAEKERVPVYALGIIAVLAPAIIIAVYTLVIDGLFSHHKIGSFTGPHKFKERLWELNCGILGLLLASGTAFVITGALKNATGKPRPDFIDRCQPIAGSVDPVPYGLSNSTICTQTDVSIMKDAFRSFPSGHSSSSFGGLFFLSLYLAGKLHLYDQRGEVWKVFLCLIPTLGAALVAISRIEDARHHPFDVIFGSLLGTLCAWVAYRQYFPSLAEPWKKGRAYPIRSWGTLPEPPSEAHAERDYARDQGKESLRLRQLPQSENEYDALHHPSSEVHGSNFPRPQVVNRFHDREPSTDGRAGGFTAAPKVRTAYGRDFSHEDSEEEIELDRLGNNGGNGSGGGGGNDPRTTRETPFVSTLNTIQRDR